jgi:hypothetical protein
VMPLALLAHALSATQSWTGRHAPFPGTLAERDATATSPSDPSGVFIQRRWVLATAAAPVSGLPNDHLPTREVTALAGGRRRRSGEGTVKHGVLRCPRLLPARRGLSPGRRHDGHLDARLPPGEARPAARRMTGASVMWPESLTPETLSPPCPAPVKKTAKTETTPMPLSSPMHNAENRILARKAIRRAKVLAGWSELYGRPFSTKVVDACLSLLVSGVFVWLGSKVLAGDFYHLTDNTTFVCGDDFCWQRGQGVAFTGAGHVMTRYHCPNHPADGRAFAKRSRALLDTPHPLGTALVLFTLLIWPRVAFSNFYCSFWAPPPRSEYERVTLEGSL